MSFESIRTGYALNSLITAIEVDDLTKKKKLLIKFVHFEAKHIVNNILGNLRVYQSTGQIGSSRYNSCMKALEFIEKFRPDVKDLFDHRIEQSKIINQSLETVSEAPLNKPIENNDLPVEDDNDVSDINEVDKKKGYSQQSESKKNKWSIGKIITALIVVMITGFFYAFYLDFERENRERVVYMKMKAIEGDADFQYYLGDEYQYGLGSIEKDEKKAVYWFSKAAEQGHVEAIHSLGFCYHSGYGVAKDEKKGFQLYKTAANRGSLSALVGVGCAYRDGEGVTKDIKKAISLLTKAAELNYYDAQRLLGVMYSSGKDTSQDPIKAYAWYRLAELNPECPSPISSFYSQRISKILSEKQRIEAEALLNKLSAKIKKEK